MCYLVIMEKPKGSEFLHHYEDTTVEHEVICTPTGYQRLLTFLGEKDAVEEFLHRFAFDVGLRILRKEKYQKGTSYNPSESYKDPSFLRYLAQNEFPDDADLIVGFEELLRGLLSNHELWVVEE